MRRVVVGSRRSAHKFENAEPYAVISFIGWWMGRCKSPPRIKRPSSMLGRIIIRCDDDRSMPKELHPDDHPMTARQAQRIAAFVQKMAPHIETLFISCEQGIGRSPGAGKAISQCYDIPMENIGEYASENLRSNEYVQGLVADALRGRVQS